MQNYGIFSSADDPAKLAASIEGILIVLSSILGGWLSSKYGINIMPDQIKVFSLEIATLVSVGGAVFGTIRTIFGLLRKGTKVAGVKLS